jgi:hypothetical protein
VALFAGCDERATNTPTEPTFKQNLANNCTGTEYQTDYESLESDIADVFEDRQAERGALQILDNIGRKVCSDPQNLDATPVMAEGFYQHVVNELPYISLDLHDDAIELVQAVFDFALQTSSPTPEIPPGAFDPETGIVAVVIPGTDAVVQTPNREAALLFDPASFPPGDPVTVALSRIPDDQQPIPGFVNFAERYEIVASVQPDPAGDGVLTALCVPDDQILPPNFAIGHYYFRQVEILVPQPVGDAVECTFAQTGYPFPEAPVGIAGLAGKLLQPLADRLLGASPLHAMYFAGTGLGGRTKSFSPFAPVEVTIDVGETVQLEVGFVDATWASDYTAVATVDEDGLVTGVSDGTATITATVGTETYSVDVVVEDPIINVLPLTCAAEPSGGDRYFRGFYFPDYPGTSLARVDLQFSGDIAGSYTLSLTARANSYDGRKIGRAEVTVGLSGRSTYVPAEFVFPSTSELVENESTITFEIEIEAYPDGVDPSNILVFYKVPSAGDPDCPIVETNGTLPPLDTSRRDGVWLTIYEDLPSGQ